MHMATPTTALPGTPPVELHKGLKQRHLTMIAIGGVIGAGLFIGSGIVIGNTGPGAFLTYALTGVIIVMVMRMLGEMATANPSTGSFADYARDALGNWAGFSVGWLYWYFWVIVVGFEAVAGAKVLLYWMDAPLWLLSLILMVLMTATNLFSVSSYGEFEYWFAGIKVAAIVLFLALGSLFVLGLWPGHSMDFSNLWAHGGFFPKGIGAIFSGIVVVIFSMVGAEIATIAAAESEDPERGITKAVNSVVLRIVVFFVGSIFLLAVIMPWNSAELAGSPYVSAFKIMGLPYVDHLMNLVVLTAVLSCLNSGLYTASRMLFVLAGRREAPASLVNVNRKGVPAAAILTSTIVGFLCVIAAAVSPDGVFLFLLNSSGAIIIFVYLLIAVSQFVLRRRTGPEKLRVKMWAFPALTLATIAAMLAILAAMYVREDTRSQLVLSLLAWGVVLVCFAVNRWREGHLGDFHDAPAVPGAARVLVLANETVGAPELLRALHEMDQADKAEYYVCVPANPVDTHQAEHSGAVWVWEATVKAAQQRLDSTLAALRTKGLKAAGALGDSRPLVALKEAVSAFKPDRIVISTHPEGRSVWLKQDVVDQAIGAHNLPVRHIVSMGAAPARAGAVGFMSILAAADLPGERGLAAGRQPHIAQQVVRQPGEVRGVTPAPAGLAPAGDPVHRGAPFVASLRRLAATRRIAARKARTRRSRARTSCGGMS
jgi:GABA permease